VWIVAVCGWLVVVVTPMWRAHVSMLIVPFALLIGRWRPNRRPVLIAGAVAALVAVPLQLHGLLAPHPYAGQEATIEAVLRDLPKGAWALSDDPGLVWRAGRRTTDDLVDTSMVGQQQGRYTQRSIAAAAADPQVCAVVVRSHLRFGAFPGLGDALERVGYHVVGSRTRDHALYVRSDCRPPRSS
jgi:hypothetical protein